MKKYKNASIIYKLNEQHKQDKSFCELDTEKLNNIIDNVEIICRQALDEEIVCGYKLKKIIKGIINKVKE